MKITYNANINNFLNMLLLRSIKMRLQKNVWISENEYPVEEYENYL